MTGNPAMLRFVLAIEQEARTLTRAEVIATVTAELDDMTGYWFRSMGYPEQRFLKEDDVLAALSRLGERE